MIEIMSVAEFFDHLEHACRPAPARHINLASGEALFRQGDKPPGLPLLSKGRIDLVRWTETGRAITIHSAQATETFAEASLYAAQCHCDAVASAPSLVRLLPKHAILSAFDASPALAQAFAQHLAQSLMAARRLLELRAITPLTDRVLARLSELADASGSVPRRVTLLSIAGDLAVTPPALYRAIAALERRGLLTRPARGRVQLVSQGH